jgi:hypothetical protein
MSFIEARKESPNNPEQTFSSFFFLKNGVDSH